ncbi:uncharacterized protein LOC131949083 [Physella acuta]|uniref:uncharacterized protein LOC131949083 n=1 Tax=Physella acuta TaxID=109671 RepID=UPI0027DE214E|nr:uncharacterized protein LOC131949083 [Physella acuta]
MWAPRSTTTTVSTQMMSQDGLNLSVTTPNDSSITTLSLETEATSEGSVFAFLLPTILTIYCLVHLAALLFVARKTGTKTTEVPIKQAEIVDSLDGIPSHFEVRSEDEVGADDWEKVIDEVAALEGYNEQDEVKTEEETGDVGDKSKWGQRSLEVQQP